MKKDEKSLSYNFVKRTLADVMERNVTDPKVFKVFPVGFNDYKITDNR